MLLRSGSSREENKMAPSVFSRFANLPLAGRAAAGAEEET